MSPATVICPEHQRTIRIDTDARAMVHVRQTLVLLEQPLPGDLYDVCPLEPGVAPETFARQSPDSTDTSSYRRGRDTIVIDWTPRGDVVPYALYNHEYSWFPGGSHLQPALFAEYRCEMRTGAFVLEMITPQSFETAVAFQRPRWPHMRSERTLVKYALKQLEGQADRPGISDNGQRVEWRIAGPQLGRSYVCVVFHRHGVALWQDQLKKATIRYKVEQLFGRLAPT